MLSYYINPFSLMNYPKEQTIQLRIYSLPELAKIYNIGDKTFRKWLKPFAEEIGPRNGRFYNVNQVKIIIAKLGSPELIQVENDLVQPNSEKPGTSRSK